MRGVLIQIDAWDPAIGVSTAVRAASHDAADICHLDGQTWWPAIAKLPKLRLDLFDGGFSDQITAPSSSLTMTTEPWPAFARLSFADARFRLWTGEIGAAWGSWTLRFDGRVAEQPQIAGGIATIDFTVDDRWLDQPLLQLYAGTSGPEGEAAQKGLVKPLAIGAPRYAPGVLIDSIDTILQLSSYGPIEAIDVALEKLSRFAAAIGDYPTFAALKSAILPAGAWATCLSGGYVRHGAPLTGQSSYLLRGDRQPGGRARLPGAVIHRLAEIAGAADKISIASLQTLDAVRPWPISLWLAEQMTPRAIIQRIAASVNAVAGVSWLGKLFVMPIGIGAPSMELRSDGSSLPPVGDVTQVSAGQPFWRLALQAERTWQVHAFGDVAFTAPLVELGAYEAATIYREGNIVSLPDGSRWLFIGTEPAAGHAPPDAAFWSTLNGPIDPVYPDGTPMSALQPAQPGADVTGDNVAKDTKAVGGTPAATIIGKLDRIEPIESDVSALALAQVDTDASLAALDRAKVDHDAAFRQIDQDAGRISEAVLRLLAESNRTREVLRDAGIIVDPVTGIVRIYAVDQLADRQSRAEIALDAQKAQIGLKASVSYVQEQIALAVLDPGQAAQLEPIIARLTQAETQIDGLNATVALKASAIDLTAVGGRVTTAEQELDALAGTVSTKVGRTEFDALDVRTGSVEQTLSSLGNVSGIAVTIRQARAVGEDAASATLRSLLAGDQAARRQIVQQAEIRQEMFAKLADASSAEAVARTLLSVQIGALDARSVQETTTRIAQDGLLSQRIDALAVTDGDQAAAIATLSSASIANGKGIAGLSTTIRQQVADAETTDEALLRALIAGDVDGRRKASQLVQIQTEFTTTLVANESASAIARQSLLARIGAAEAAFASITKVLADTTQALTQRIPAAEAVMNDAATGLAATRARLIVEETSRATADEANADAIELLDAAINDPVSGLPATRATVAAYRQAQVDGDEALASAIAQVRATIDGVGDVGVEAAFEAVVDRLGKIEGRYTVTVDANGNVSGFQLIGSDAGPASLNLINTDLRMGTGRVVFNNGSFMQVQGVGFGVGGEFLEWFGPTMGIAHCSRTNAVAYKTITGSAYFGGSLSAGTITNKAQTTSTAGPGLTVSTGTVGSNGHRRNVILSYAWTRSAQMNSAANGGAAQGQISAQLKLYRSGAEIGTLDVTGDWQRTTYGGASSPASYREDMGGSITVSDTSGGSLVEYSATLLVRDLGPNPTFGIVSDGVGQNISIIEVEEE